MDVFIGRRRVVAVTGGDDRTVRVWDLIDRRQIGTPLTGHAGDVMAVATVVLPGGRVVVITSSSDLMVRAWDLATGERSMDRLPGLETRAIAAHPTIRGCVVLGGTYLATAELTDALQERDGSRGPDLSRSSVR